MSYVASDKQFRDEEAAHAWVEAARVWPENPVRPYFRGFDRIFEDARQEHSHWRL